MDSVLVLRPCHGHFHEHLQLTQIGWALARGVMVQGAAGSLPAIHVEIECRFRDPERAQRFEVEG